MLLKTASRIMRCLGGGRFRGVVAIMARHCSMVRCSRLWWAAICCTAMLHVGCSSPFDEDTASVSEAESPPVKRSVDETQEIIEPRDSKAAATASNPRRSNELPLSDLVDQIDDAVVFVTASDALGDDVSVGTGCIIDRTGLVATNRHVVDEAISVHIRLRDGGRFPVRGIVAESESHDLVIMKVDGLPESIETFALREPPKLRPGDPLIAIGHPMQFQFTVSDGILSALRRTDELPEIYQEGLHANVETEWLQTTAAISNGSSGGPLLTTRGEFVGINTWVANGQNLGFAISVRHLTDLAERAEQPPVAFPLRNAPVIVGTRAAVLKREFQEELQNQLSSLLSGTVEDRAKSATRLSTRVASYAARCLELMKESETDSERVDALVLAHQIWGSWSSPTAGGQRHFAKMYELAESQLARSDALSRVVDVLGDGPYSSEMSGLVSRLLREHPSPAVQARAGLALVKAMQGHVDAEMFVPEQIELLNRMRLRLGNVEVGGVLVEDLAGEQLLTLRSLRAGGIAQELAGPDHTGQSIRLSDYSGRIVLLDFWADAAPLSRDSYRLKRELVQELQDRPFTLLGVNCDETPQRGSDLAQSGIITWPTLYDGPGGRMAGRWMVDTLPRSFVIDADGIIRFVNLRNEELEDAVHALLEAEYLQLPEDIVSSESDWTWYYKMKPPPANWMDLEFAARQWKRGQAPLGYGGSQINRLLDYGDIDNKRPVAYFRHTFEVPDLSICGELILRMQVDDGAVVFLNGTEVLRHNVTAASGNALHIAPAAETDLIIELDPGCLQAGTNLIAVEVHQCDPQSADLLFDLSLSSRPFDVRRIPDARSAHTRVQFCKLAAHFAMHDETVDSVLKTLGGDRKPLVRTWALAARIQRGSIRDETPLIDPDSDEERPRLVVASLLNGRAWSEVRTANAPPDAVANALRMARAALRLAEGHEKLAGNVANTCGVALYRSGRHEEAITCLQNSTELNGENPLDLIYVSLCQYALGSREEAMATFAKVEALTTRDDWAAEDEAAFVLEEARSTLRADDPDQEQ
jgi:S1-C subfamily serine protease/peroxiredoxin